MRDTASRFAFNLRTIQKIRKNSVKLLASVQEGTPNAQFEALKVPKFPDIDEALYEFVQIARGAGLPLSGSVLRCRALQSRDILLKKDHTSKIFLRLSSLGDIFHTEACTAFCETKWRGRQRFGQEFIRWDMSSPRIADRV